MVFPNQFRMFLDSKFTKPCSLIALTTILAVGCTGRGEKKVAITCPPGESQGPDGKCASTGGSQGASGTGTIGSTDTSGSIGTETNPELATEAADNTSEQNPNDTDTQGNNYNPLDEPNTLPNSQYPHDTNDDPDISPNSQNPQDPNGNSNNLPDPQNRPGTLPHQQDPATNTPTRPQVVIPTDTQRPIPGQDPINQTESVTNLFIDAPQTSAEGAPTLAFKLVDSPTQGKVARVAFSHTNGVTNTEYRYHKKTLIMTASVAPTATVDGSQSADLSTIPVSVSFEWNNKKCDSGVVEVEFEAKTKVVTCI